MIFLREGKERGLQGNEWREEEGGRKTNVVAGIRGGVPDAKFETLLSAVCDTLEDSHSRVFGGTCGA